MYFLFAVHFIFDLCCLKDNHVVNMIGMRKIKPLYNLHLSSRCSSI